MTPPDDPTIGQDGLLHAPDGRLHGEFVTAIRTGIVEFAQTGVIFARLYEAATTDPATGRSSPETRGVQVCLSPESARVLAARLTAASDELLGLSHPRQ
jgi:hypothetical protein